MGMIKTEREYTMTKKRITEYEVINKEGFAKNDEAFKFNLEIGATVFVNQMKDEVKEYESIKNGKIPKYFFYFENIGILLIALRIKHGLTQTDVANKLEVPASQVCRDENNDYYGVSTKTISKILEIYNEKLILSLV